MDVARIAGAKVADPTRLSMKLGGRSAVAQCCKLAARLLNPSHSGGRSAIGGGTKMRRICLVVCFGLGALLLSPAAALAQYPERLNGTFDFQDKDELDKSTLEFQVEGREIGVEGSVRDLSASDGEVTIRYRTDFPNQAVAGNRNASVTQQRQVLITLEVGDPPIYSGQAAPIKCKVQAKLHDQQANGLDDPEKAQATLHCDLGRDWSELAVAPSQAVLDAVETAFDSREDVKVDTRKGKLQIKHRGEPVPTP